VHIGLGRLHRIVLIVHGARGTGEVVDLIDLDIERERDVMSDQLEPGMAEKMRDVLLGAGKEVIDTDNLLSALNQPINQMRAQETRAAGDQDSLAWPMMSHDSLVCN
jgi:hypothetical protein